MRLKKVLVPSNYNPLRGDGTDKRFQKVKQDMGEDTYLTLTMMVMQVTTVVGNLIRDKLGRRM